MTENAKFKVGEDVLYMHAWSKGRVEKVMPIVGATQLYVINSTFVVSEDELESLYESLPYEPLEVE